MRTSVLTTMATVLGLWATVTPARAQTPPAQCTVTEIRASKGEKGGVDARLDHLKGRLTRGPFESYDTFKLLGEQSVVAERQKPTSVRLVNGNLTLLYKDKLNSQGGKARLRFGVDMDSKQGTRTLSTEYKVDSGDPIFIAAQPFEGATYVLVLTCTAP